MNSGSRSIISKLIQPGISLKLYAIVLLAAIGIIGITTMALLNERHDLEADKRTELQHLVEIAVSAVSAFETQVTAGELSKPEAQKLAKQAIEKLCYQKDHYFWINDMQAHMVMHPIKPDLSGKDLSGLKDPAGKHLFVEFVNVVKKNGSGFVGYKWPKPGKDTPQP